MTTNWNGELNFLIFHWWLCKSMRHHDLGGLPSFTGPQLVRYWDIADIHKECLIILLSNEVSASILPWSSEATFELPRLTLFSALHFKQRNNINKLARQVVITSWMTKLGSSERQSHLWIFDNRTSFDSRMGNILASGSPISNSWIESHINYIGYLRHTFKCRKNFSHKQSLLRLFAGIFTHLAIHLYGWW